MQDGISLTQIEIIKTENGAVNAFLHGQVKGIADLKNITFHPGISFLFVKSKDTFFKLKDGLWKLKM